MLSFSYYSIHFQIQFFDEVDKAKKDLHVNSKEKIKMCNIDGHSFYFFTLRTWIGDSGASCFITNDPTGIYDAEPINESIEAANGMMKATIKGKKDVIIKQVDGRTTCYTLEPGTSQILQASQSKSVFLDISAVKRKSV